VNVYATLADLRRYLGLTSAQTGDDDLLLMLLGAASRLIEGYAARQFYPARQTRAYTVDDPALLLLHGDLLHVHSLTNGDGSAIATAAYHLEPAGEAVKSSILLDRTQAVFTHDGDPVDAIAIDGTWGYHPGWPEAWTDSGDSVQDDPLGASATALAVTDADAPGPTGYGARFAVGQPSTRRPTRLRWIAQPTARRRPATIKARQSPSTSRRKTYGRRVCAWQAGSTSRRTQASCRRQGICGGRCSCHPHYRRMCGRFSHRTCGCG
jgi:hypothetical protein